METEIIRNKPKFDTCFFERYAKITLETILGDHYAGLENRDRPDLQDIELDMGIEVTRAMHESKAEAISLLNEMAVDEIVDVPELTNKEMYRLGYTYGLISKDIVGPTEYYYWRQASPLSHVIENKVNKVTNGFYGNFKEMGLYIFTKDDVVDGELLAAMHLTSKLQSGFTSGFQTLYISEIQNLYVCDIASMSYKQYHISDDLCRKFFKKATDNCSCL